MKIKSILVDTSALIALANISYKYHSETKEHFIYAKQNGINLYLSSIVVSEFTVKQGLEEIPQHFLSLFRYLSFTFSHANLAGKITDFKYHRDGSSRDCVKDDFKILAQTKMEEIDAILTGDFKGVNSFFRPVIQAYSYNIKMLEIDKAPSHYFRKGPPGQSDLFDGDK